MTSSLLPMMQALRSEGAAGWMVCRAARTTDRRLLRSDGRDTLPSLSLTLGSGSRALAPPREAGESRKQKGKRGADAAFPSIDALRGLNNEVDHAVPIGALGDLIHGQGWQTAVSGDADTFSQDESGRLLAMDSRGIVDVTPPFLRPARADVAAPFGLRDDTDALTLSLRHLPPRVALAVIVFGDLARADAYGPLCLPAQRDAHRANALRELNGLLERLKQDIAADTSFARCARLYLLSPAPAASSDAFDRIAPVLLWGRDVPPGRLTSPSTRLPGIVVNTDLLPAIAADLGLPVPRSAIGRPFQVQSAAASERLVTAWRAQHDRLLLSEHLKDVYGGLPTGQTLLVLAAFWAWRKRWKRWTRAFAAAIVALPTGMLLLPSLPFVSASVGSAGVALATWTLLSMILAAAHRDAAGHAALRAPVLLTALLAVLLAALMLDLMTGSRLLRQAWMSYSVMETARFYGIGNEYMGAAIGAACILSGASGQGAEGKGRIPYLLFSGFSCLLLFLLGYNRFGAKVGAIPSAGCALGVSLLVLWRGRVRGRDAGSALLGSLLLLGAFAWLDARHGAGEQSHLARAFVGGAGGVWQIARRKLLLEGYLLTHSVWSMALVSASGVFWLRVKMQRQPRDKPQVGGEVDSVAAEQSRRAVISGLVTGAVVSLLCNDSGVTASALIMLFGCAWLFSIQNTSSDGVSSDSVKLDSIKLESVSHDKPE